MSISWGNWEVRVYAAEAWVSLAPRFAVERPEIVDRIGEILTDYQPAVRLQAAQNLQVICLAASGRMWEMGERIAAAETDAQVLTAYLGRSLRRFSHAEPERCENILAIAKRRLDDFADHESGRDHILGCLGEWVAQLQAGQGRPLASTWLDEWAADPERFQQALNAYPPTLGSPPSGGAVGYRKGGSAWAMCPLIPRWLSQREVPSTASGPRVASSSPPPGSRR